MNRNLCAATFLVGLAAVGWVGFGYVGTNPLALTMTTLIAAVYLTGALELRRFQQATAALDAALAAVPEPLHQLADWLARVPAALQNPVRLRIEGERAALPGPALTPYLVGLLVILGMLGTFLGMVVTLKGAVMALESTTDLATIRAALAAPVKGLGLAFGTSVAGVAASAMLGLMSALCRRERLQSAQLLDTRIATVLRVFSRAHQRQQSFEAQQQQARVMPELAGQLQALMAQLAQQSAALNETLLANQAGFHRHAQAVYTDLAKAVGQSLQQSLSDSARLAGETIQPVVEATMAGIARETAALQTQVAGQVTAQLDGLASRFDRTVGTVADGWTTALARHERSSGDLAEGLRQTLGDFNQTFEQRSAALLATVAGTHAALQGDLQATLAGLAQETAGLHQRLAGTVGAQLDGLTERFGTTVTTVADTWRDALAEHQTGSERLAGALQASQAALAQTFEQRAAALLATVGQAHAALQTDLAAQDRQRLAAWTGALDAMAAALQREWQQAGAQALGQQQQICRTLEQTAADMHTQAQAHARETIAEVAGLMRTAAEAPRVAAEVIGQLRAQLSDSMARDNGLLEERSRIMGTLNALLEAVNLAATEQRGAIDALVASSTALLDRVGAQFTAQVDAESTRLASAAAQITGSAVEVASQGEAFALAVQLFSDSSEALVTHLQRLEGALDKSTARSDEQLAYYVAQAREIIDLSIMSQKQVVDDLQRLAARPAPLAGEVA